MLWAKVASGDAGVRSSDRFCRHVILSPDMREPRRPRSSRKATQPAPPPSTDISVARGHGWHLVALGILVLASYSNSFRAGMVFDNAPVIAQDLRIRAA